MRVHCMHAHQQSMCCIPSNGAPSTLAHMNLRDSAGLCHACEPAAWLHRALGEPCPAVYAHSPSHSLAIWLQPDGKYLLQTIGLAPYPLLSRSSIQHSHAQHPLHYIPLERKPRRRQRTSWFLGVRHVQDDGSGRCTRRSYRSCSSLGGRTLASCQSSCNR